MKPARWRAISSKTSRAARYIVVPSGSCTSMVTHHFADLFHKEPETLARVHALEQRVCEFSTFLTEVAGVEDVGARFDDVVTFHDGCHALRELGIKDGAAPPAGATCAGWSCARCCRPRSAAASAAPSR